MISNPYPILDGHNDTLQNAYTNKIPSYSFFAHNETGHMDLIRALKGGFSGGFFAMFVPPEPGTWGPIERELTRTEKGYRVREAPRLGLAYAQRYVVGLAATLFRLETESDGQFKVVRTVDQLEVCLQQGVIAAIFHIEGAGPIDINLHALHVFYQAGLRSLGIVWSRANDFGFGVPFRYPSSPDTGPGLTEAGERLVKTCNRLGILLDLAHLNEKGFWDVARLSDAPLVTTHACVHALTPTTRNLTDKQIDAVGESGGVIGVNFNVGDLRPDGERNPATPMTLVVEHATYIADRIGIDHVALGSDFDGATIPNELGTVEGLPQLLIRFRDAGYDDDALKKITHQNWLRVLRQTWKR